MKKLTSVFLSVLLVLSLSACGSQNTPAQPAESQIRNAETISSETITSETVDTTDTASDSESADATEGSETPNAGESDSSSDIHTDSNTGRPTAENKPLGTTQPAETNSQETPSSVNNPAPVETQKPAPTNPPGTQKPMEPSAPDSKPPVPVTPSETQPSDTEPAPTPEPTRNKTLIVYFSWSSNTERMANTIQEQTGGDLLELIPATAYPTDYTLCTEVALAERDNNARPAIQNLPASIDEYDTILIGYPIWWHTAPMIIGTFLENYDLTGIDVYPFTQSASMDRTQFNHSMEFVRECANGATVHDGLFARYSDTSAITAYLNNNNLSN